MSEPTTWRSLLPTALALGAVGALSMLAALPYQIALMPEILEQAPLPTLIVATLIQGSILMTLLAIVGLRAHDALGQRLLGLTALTPRTLAPMAIAGLAMGALVMGLDLILMPQMPTPISNPELLTKASPWRGLLASFYGGFGEELMCRLFLVSVLAWLARRVTQDVRKAFAVGIFGAAVIFGLAHLPATAAIWPLTPIVVTRALVLNMIVGIPAGILFYRRGFFHAVCFHFFADICLHVLFPLLTRG